MGRVQYISVYFFTTILCYVEATFRTWSGLLVLGITKLAEDGLVESSVKRRHFEQHHCFMWKCCLVVKSHRAVAVPKCHRLPGFKAYNIWGFYSTASALSPSDYKVVTVVAKISGCNSLLHICGRSSSWRRALHLFQSLPEGSLQQTVQSIGAITAAFSQVGLLGGLNPRSDAWIQVANIPFRRLVPNLSHGMLDLVDSHSTDAQLVWSTFYPYMKYYTCAFFFVRQLGGLPWMEQVQHCSFLSPFLGEICLRFCCLPRQQCGSMQPT